MILYNLFPLLAGPFPQWNAHFARAAAMGFDWVYVNPIQKPGSSHSLYSVADYFAVNPQLLDRTVRTPPDEQVRRMIRQARGAGLRVMIDLVINHCAFDSPVVRAHPEWFVRDTDGAIAHPSCQDDGRTVIWGDLVQFDHRNSRDPEGLHRYCARIVAHLLDLGFEGFRCDAAYQVPPATWRRLIAEARARHPGVCFAAETLGCTAEQTRDTARAGFDFVFNSSKWWNYRDPWLLEGYDTVRAAAPSIGFPESHDTARLAAELDGSVNGLKIRYLFSALFSAGVMIPVGFEFGFRRPLHVVKTTPADWEETGIDLCAYIGRVNAIKRRYPVFQEDGPTDFPAAANPNLLLMTKASTRTRQRALLILNLDLWNHQEFAAENFRAWLPEAPALRDVSPEFPLDRVPEPFHYALRPGQGIVLVAADA